MCLQVLQEAAPSRDRNQGLKPPPQGFEPTGQSVTLHRKTIEEGVDCSEGRARVLAELGLDAGSPPPPLDIECLWGTCRFSSHHPCFLPLPCWMPGPVFSIFILGLMPAQPES